MTDIKTIMSWLEGLTEPDWRMFHSDSEVQNIAKETLALLKEQEARQVITDLYGDYCPWCSTKATRAMGVQKLHLGTKFCPYCGQAVKWE